MGSPDYIGADDELCPRCLGDGGWHDCGEDCCPCANPDDAYWVECDECHGEGRIFSPVTEDPDAR